MVVDKNKVISDTRGILDQSAELTSDQIEQFQGDHEYLYDFFPPIKEVSFNYNNPTKEDVLVLATANAHATDSNFNSERDRPYFLDLLTNISAGKRTDKKLFNQWYNDLERHLETVSGLHQAILDKDFAKPASAIEEHREFNAYEEIKQSFWTFISPELGQSPIGAKEFYQRVGELKPDWMSPGSFAKIVAVFAEERDEREIARSQGSEKINLKDLAETMRENSRWVAAKSKKVKDIILPIIQSELPPMEAKQYEEGYRDVKKSSDHMFLPEANLTRKALNYLQEIAIVHGYDNIGQIRRS